MKYPLTSGMVVGTFFGNWLVAPFFTHHDFFRGFWTGVIAAVLILLIMPFVERKVL